MCSVLPVVPSMLREQPKKIMYFQWYIFMLIKQSLGIVNLNDPIMCMYIPELSTYFGLSFPKIILCNLIFSALDF